MSFNIGRWSTGGIKLKLNISLLQTAFLDNSHILAITETWIKTENDHFYIDEITPAGYKAITKNRENGRGGGIALTARNGLKPKDITKETFTSFEHSSILLSSGQSSIKVIVIYRPPGSNFADFLEDFTSLLERLHQNPIPFILVGDFNIHVDNHSDAKAKRFLEVLNSFDLIQHVDFATHTHGHTLDLVISQRHAELHISNVRLGELISDHFSIKCNLSIVIDEPSTRSVLMRKIKSINIDDFKDDLRSLDIVSNPNTDLNDLVKQYNSSLKSLLDKHAPLKRCAIKVKQNKWYTSDIHKLRTERRKQQRKWRKSQSISDLEKLIKSRDTLKALINDTKTSFYRNVIQKSSHNQGALFKTVNTLLHKQNGTPFPDKPPTSFSNELNDCFISKIQKKSEMNFPIPETVYNSTETSLQNPYRLSSRFRLHMWKNSSKLHQIVPAHLIPYPLRF